MSYDVQPGCKVIHKCLEIAQRDVQEIASSGSGDDEFADLTDILREAMTTLKRYASKYSIELEIRQELFVDPLKPADGAGLKRIK